MALYNIPYFLFVLVVLLNLLGFFYTLLSTFSHLFILFYLFIYSMLLPLVFFAPNIAYFLVVSSGLTVVFLLMFFFLNTSLVDSIAVSALSAPSLYLYLLVYSSLIFALLTLLESLALAVGGRRCLCGGNSSLTMFAVRGTSNQRLVFRTQLFVILLNLAGLPPFLVFFLKLGVIVEFFSSGFGYVPLTFLILLYLFLSIFYYYRVVRSVISPVGVVQPAQYKTKTALRSFSNPNMVNETTLYVRTFFFTILLTVCCFPFVCVLDFFLFFTSNWPL